jgi:TolB-like protein/Flp pilus assembly protein TadD
LSFFNELKRRNVFRAGIAYIITAWLIAQVAGLAADSFAAPAWVMKMIITMLLLGCPLAIFFAWAYELTPAGLRREPDVQPGQSITGKTARKLDRAIIFALILALAWFSWDKFIADPQRDRADFESALREATQEQGDEAAIVAPLVKRSIAVLPFVNMSEDAGNEYFADGLSEELLNLLVKIPELQVAARTSSFSFKGKELKISEIAQELNVSHILEGSVRKSGDKVRITAQLIKADDGFHLWSENFDRTLDDIFKVQDEIASEVANALQLTLLGQSSGNRGIDPQAYESYLKGLYFLNQRGAENARKSEEVLLQAIELEPGYATAWSLLAISYYTQIRQNVITREEGHALAMNAIDRAMSLDPDLGVIWGTYGFLKKNLEWDWDTAQSALAKAHQLEPNTNIIRIWRASLAQTLGRLDEAVSIYEQALAADPLNLSAYSSLGVNYRKIRRFDDAIAIFEKQIELRPHYHWAYFNLGKSYLFKGDAAKALVEIEKNPPNVYREVGLVLANTTLGNETEAHAVLQRLVAQEGKQNAVWVAEAFGWRGDKDQAFEWLERAYMQKDIGLSYLLGNNIFEDLWDDPRWMELLQKLNLLEHWQAMPPEYGGPTEPAG